MEFRIIISIPWICHRDSLTAVWREEGVQECFEKRTNRDNGIFPFPFSLLNLLFLHLPLFINGSEYIEVI